MTTYAIFSIRDRQLDTFMSPFFAPARGAAVRSFVDEVKRDGSPMSQHPEDYSLHLIGSFDDVTSSIQSHAPEQIALASDYATPGGMGGTPMTSSGAQGR